MPDKEHVLRNVNFDDECRLVINDEELAAKLHAQLMGKGYLVLRVNPWTCQKFKTKKPIDTTINHSTCKSIDNAKMNFNYIYWARDPVEPDPPGGTCPDPRDLGDLGCGCDIVINVDCAPPADE